MDPVIGGEDSIMEEGVPEVEIETVEEKYIPHELPAQEHPGMLELGYYYTLNYFSNPWAFLILTYIIYRLIRMVWYLISEPLVERYSQWQEKREEMAEAARYKKNPDEYHAKMEAMEVARNRMQERYNEDAEVEAIKRVEKEERQREENIKDWENHQRGGGYKNKGGEKVDKEREALVQQARVKGKKGYTSTRPDNYNPLMGDMGGSGNGANPRRGGGGSRPVGGG